MARAIVFGTPLRQGALYHTLLQHALRLVVLFALLSSMRLFLEVPIELRSKDAPSLEGKIEFISKLVDPATGSVEVHALFSGDPDRILSGVPGFLLIP